MKAAISIPDRVSPARHSLARAAFCQFLSRGEHASRRGADGFCTALFPDDRHALQILRPEMQRAAVDAAKTSVAGWAQELTAVAVGEFISTLPGSAASKLIAKGTSVSFPSGATSIKFPARAAGPATASWIAEGAPIPVRQDVLSGVDLQPKKVGVLLVLSQELANHSNAQETFMMLLREDAAYTLDACYFSTSAASSAGLAGLLSGLSPVTLPTPTGGAPSAVADDLGVLAAAANAQAGSSGQVLWIMAAREAAQCIAVCPHLDGFIIPSSALPNGRVVACDPAAIVHAAGSVSIESSIHTTLHMDSVPLQIGTPGAPPVVASPAQSLFQTAMISVRMLIDISFAKRRSGAVQYADVTWA